ncbi:MAG TPA: hypothetical protein PLQ53_04385 [Saprospiraceae bacterium]|jgi:hypothetical protein|nr:hypothetical protein [Saprospiraceae bacterium]
MTVFRYTFLLYCIILFTFSSQAQSKDGMVLKTGVSSTVFYKDRNAKLIHHASAGNTVGIDGLVYNGKLLIQPGIYFMSFPSSQGPLKGAFRDVLSREAGSYDYGILMPVRLGVDLIDLGAFRLKSSVGMFGIYSPEGIEINTEAFSKTCYVAGGWTLHAGMILKFFTLDVDYYGSLCKPSNGGPLYMQSIAFTAGFYF